MKVFPWVKEKVLRFLMISMSLLSSFDLGKELDKDSIRKILLIQFGGLGDMLLITPAIKSIIKTFPQAKISILGFSEYNSNFLLNFPNVSEADISGEDWREPSSVFLKLDRRPLMNF